jgi:hypothetical protein
MGLLPGHRQRTVEDLRTMEPGCAESAIAAGGRPMREYVTFPTSINKIDAGTTDTILVVASDWFKFDERGSCPIEVTLRPFLIQRSAHL